MVCQVMMQLAHSFSVVIAQQQIAASQHSGLRVIRGQRVLLDEDLAAIYGVSTSALNQAMRRNRSRFPPNFVMELDRARVGISKITNCDLKDGTWQTPKISARGLH
jgi:hypothetical protein